MAPNSNGPRSQEDYVTQISEEIEGRVTKELSQEFSRTETRILGALSRLDDFLLNSLIQGHSGTAPQTSRNTYSINQGTNEDASQSNPHPEAGLFNNQMIQNSRPEDGHDMVTGATKRHDMVTGVQKEKLCGHDMVTRVQKESLCGHNMVTKVQKESLCGHDIVTGVQKENLCGHDMVTGVKKESLCGHDMATGVHMEVTHCSLSTSSGKQRKNRSISQPQFRSENTLATIEADQTLLALQQLANNNISGNFYNSINRSSKLPKSLTTTMPTLEGKSEKFELFKDLFQTSLKIHNQLTEDDRIN